MTDVIFILHGMGEHPKGISVPPAEEETASRSASVCAGD